MISPWREDVSLRVMRAARLLLLEQVSTALAGRCGRLLSLGAVSVRDSRLLELARLGDEAAFAEVVRRHRPFLLAHCRSIVGDSAAQDAVQQALISAWSALRRGREVRSARGWLFTIAHHAALQLLRGQDEPPDELSVAVAGAGSPHELLERRSQVRATLAAVAELPPHERDALLLTAVYGHSGRDTARALGVSEPQVRQLVFRARGRAREALLRAPPFALGFGTLLQGLRGLLRAARASSRPRVAPPRATALVRPAQAGGHWAAAAFTAAVVAATPPIVSGVAGAHRAQRTMGRVAPATAPNHPQPAAVGRRAASSRAEVPTLRSASRPSVHEGSPSYAQRPGRTGAAAVPSSATPTAERGLASAPARRLASVAGSAGMTLAGRLATAPLRIVRDSGSIVPRGIFAPVQQGADALPSMLSSALRAADEPTQRGSALAEVATTPLQEAATGSAGPPHVRSLP
jgi:RNA polymerase sigma factor (sigma-70 family)